MIVKRAQLVGVSADSFRQGEKAFIIGAVMVTPSGLGERLCFHAIFDDGKTVFIPVYSVDNGSYRIEPEDTPIVEHDNSVNNMVSANN